MVKDKRYTVYSPLDGQPCADHDRATGEGVGAQEYTLVKMKVAELSAPLQAAAGKDVFFLAATLRPETMYGQTNCWVLPEGEYVLVEGLGNEAYVMAERSANNLAYQVGRPVENLRIWWRIGECRLLGGVMERVGFFCCYYSLLRL